MTSSTRERAERIARDSQRRWHSAWEAGRYDDQLVPVETTLDGDPITVERDGHPRPETTKEDRESIPLGFRDEDGIHHAGDSSGIVDGASALLVSSRDAAQANGWEPMARVRQTAVVGVDPITMLTGPIPATEQVLEEAGLSVDDVDLFEVNEAFAWLEETAVDWDRTNVNGGAIAHGHPLGATGAGLITKLVHALDRRGEDVGLSTMCIGSGRGIATSWNECDILTRRERRGFLQGKARYARRFRHCTPRGSSVGGPDSPLGVPWWCHSHSRPVASHRLPVSKAGSLPTG